MEIVETNYYDVLGVRSSASEEVIRQAFYHKGSQVHPDRNRNDPNAAERYKALTEAYEVLIDPAKREEYDRSQGYKKLREKLVDATEAFKDYIGQLAIGSDALSELSDNPENLPDKLKTLMLSVQKEREEKLAATLKGFLNQYVQGDKDSFSQQAMSEAQRLAGTAYQVDMLHIIGDIYSRQAAQELGKKAILLGVPFLAEWVRNNLNYRKSQNIIEKDAFRMVQLQEEIRRQMKSTSDPVVAEPYIKDETLAKSLWKLNAADIEVTLVHVCQMVLHDGDATKEELTDRAMALKILGNIFQKQQARMEIGGTSGEEKSVWETSRGEIVVETDDNIGLISSEADISSSADELPCFGQVIVRIVACLCNRTAIFDSDAHKAQVKLDSETRSFLPPKMPRTFSSKTI